MRKVVLFAHVSLDGFAAGPNGELNWISYNQELENYAAGIVDTVGSPMYGRVTYHLMEGYWPTVLNDPSGTEHQLKHAKWIEDVPKIVFSRTLQSVEWNNTTLIKDNVAEEVEQLKQQPGKDFVIFGSPGLAHSFMEMNLIDEYQLTLQPVLLGAGMPLFKNIQDKANLKLLRAQTFNSGVIGLHYQTINAVSE